jgi:quinol monooxygenase YgiN
MTSLRILHQLSRELGDDEDLLVYTAAARCGAGCQEAQCYRGFEHRQHVAVVELWSDEFAYSDYWRLLLESGEVFKTVLRSSAGRSDGRNGAEFYGHQPFSQKEGVWMPPAYQERSSVVLWAAGAAVRIIIQATRGGIPESLPPLIRWSQETMREPGCLQFESFQSIESGAGSDTLTLELWADQVIYDRHWALRRRSVAAGAALASGNPQPERPPRTFGTTAFEWYQQVLYSHLYDCWRPVDVERWSETVRWPI